MKTIKNTISTLAIILISFKSFAQPSLNKEPFAFTAKDISIGLYMPKDSNYLFTCPAAPDSQRFIYHGHRLFTKLGEFRLVKERGYFTKDSSFYITESESVDKDNNPILIILTSDFKKEVATLEFRRPLISYMFTLKNEISKKETLIEYVN
jgi:hypothetical protein